MFYGGHRRYLNPDGVSPIEPPVEYRSKRQIRQIRLSRQSDSRNEEKISFQMHFQKKGQEVENEAENAKKFRKVANIVRNTITLDHFSSVQKDDWNEQLRAGVKMWVNKHTGEVATECPWQNVPQTPLQRMIRAKNQRRQSNASIPSIQPHEVGMGTGSLVYDGKEVEELFKILDDAK